MDLNYFLSRHQFSLMRAASVPSAGARASHRGLADGYGRRIRDFQLDVGATAAQLRVARA